MIENTEVTFGGIAFPAWGWKKGTPSHLGSG
jgi:hypothetical protein